MKTKRTYPSGCTWCGATGIVSNNARPPMSTMSNSTTVCPVCNGTKIITITEEYDDVVIEGIPINPIIDISKIEQENSSILTGSWKDCRKRTGLSLRQVAERIGLSSATISRIENNQGNYMYDTYRRLNYFYHNVIIDAESIPGNSKVVYKGDVYNVGNRRNSELELYQDGVFFKVVNVKDVLLWKEEK